MQITITCYVDVLDFVFTSHRYGLSSALLLQQEFLVIFLFSQ